MIAARRIQMATRSIKWLTHFSTESPLQPPPGPGPTAHVYKAERWLNAPAFGATFGAILLAGTALFERSWLQTLT